MTEFAMLFPGQGSQYVGMLSSYFNTKTNNIFKDTFNEASDYIHYDLLKLIQKGPKLTLNQSQYTQASILTASLAIYRFWNYQKGILPLFMSGHSLGEYSALVCSNSIKFSDALNIVFIRGKLMQKITQNKSTLMQAIIGIDKKKIEHICTTVSNKKIVSLASINSNDQIVIVGDECAVNKASINCKKIGAQKIFKMNLNIPAHCILMKPISQKLKKILKITNIISPEIPVINNVDVKIEHSKKKIINALIRQIYNTVRWKEIIDLIKSKNIFTMLEIGPNQILTNLNKKDQNINSFNTNNLTNFLIAFNKINYK
ncbi:ACP S-malonyltransferase [Buchnera aphidicola]|uniref:Malonyl CoA-acyl carrier protein transacylase n=1 Tax=Buchnera aphidicola subsp. Uroleucon sonchi TaxID=118118 RepID=A0A6C1FAY3_BUCUN|nr:ACP S-malonyltransferase [Buchnera aphidicola]QIE02058.1 ACP S-malonyltransferase [Buchnera aphidicola (Uroleucon sonchi)]